MTFGGEIAQSGTNCQTELKAHFQSYFLVIFRSILALFTKPGDQYSSEESLASGVFQNGENEQVVHGN